MTSKTKLFLALFFFVGIVCFAFLQGERIPFGFHDFQAYWGASHLLAQGERFNEHDTLLSLQQSLNTDNPTQAVMTWNPP